MNQAQLEKVRSAEGFIAALDQSGGSTPKALRLYGICLLYTSDAADERSSVDLGGRRIIKKKKNNIQKNRKKKKKTANGNTNGSSA